MIRVDPNANICDDKPASAHSPGVEDKLCAPDRYSGRSLNFYEFPKWIIVLIADDGTVVIGEPAARRSRL